MMNLQGNTILITGGGSGIGGGLAQAFHKKGNKVIIGGRRREVLEKMVSANAGMEAIVLDTTNPASISAAAHEVTEKHPALNVIVNNAGVQRAVDFAGDLSAAEADMEEEINTNIRGVLRMTAAFLPHLKAQPSATIVNISSGLAFLPIARYPVYCATKAFVHSFCVSLRHQLRNTSVRVIELAPPWVATDLDARHKAHSSSSGMSPMPLADFIAAAMQDLASDVEELPVAGAKFLYGAGVNPQAAATFAQINR